MAIREVDFSLQSIWYDGFEMKNILGKKNEDVIMSIDLHVFVYRNEMFI